MGFSQREIHRLHDAMIKLGEGDEKYCRLHAARQALEWALEPNGVKAPLDAIMGTQEAQEGCLDEGHLILS